jgi:hypothetical protein
MGVLCSVNISYVGLNFLLNHDDNFYFYFLFYATIESLMREINYWLLPSYLPTKIQDFKVHRTELVQLILFFMIVAPGFKDKTRYTPYVSPENKIAHMAINKR